MSTMTRRDAHRLSRLEKELAAELADLELTGLEDRAAGVREELKQVRSKIAAAKGAREKESLERIQQKQRSEEAFKEQKREEKVRKERQSIAETWMRERQAVWGGTPLEIAETLLAADEEGIDRRDLFAVCIPIRSRTDERVCLTARGSFLQRDYFPCDRRELADYL